MEKKVYILFEESDWFGQEPYADVVDVFESEEDAVNALKEQRWDFLEKHEEKYKEDIIADENYTVH